MHRMLCIIIIYNIMPYYAYSIIVVLYADDRVWILLYRVLILILVCILLASLE